MSNRPSFRLTALPRKLAARLGHDAIWLIIAVLFCLVEAAVHVTQLGAKLVRVSPGKRTLANAASFRPVSRVPEIVAG